MVTVKATVKARVGDLTIIIPYYSTIISLYYFLVLNLISFGFFIILINHFVLGNYHSARTFQVILTLNCTESGLGDLEIIFRKGGGVEEG